MNMQRTVQAGFSSTTPLTHMPVTTAGTTGLLIPIRPIVRIESTAPRRIDTACHAIAVSLSKACAATKVLAAAFDLIRLALKRFAARRAHDCNERGFSNHTICTLPCSTALPITEIVSLNRAGGNFTFNSAPFTSHDHCWPMASLAAINAPAAFCVPILSLKFLVACLTSNQHNSLLYGFHTPNYTIKERAYAGYDKDVIGNMFELEMF